MVTITDSFIDIIARQRKIGYPFPDFLCPPASFDQIKEIEKLLGFEFNDELKELYSFANGTSIKTPTELGLTGLIPIYNFLNLKDAVDCYKIKIAFEYSFENSTTKYKPGLALFPFLDNHSGDTYWVDLNKWSINYGRIYWTNTLAEEPDYKFDSLTDMFDIIRTAYEKEIITVDEDKYLNCDYSNFDNLAKVKS